MSAFFCAKTLTTAPVEVVQVFLFAVIVYFMTGYQARALETLLNRFSSMLADCRRMLHRSTYSSHCTQGHRAHRVAASLCDLTIMRVFPAALPVPVSDAVSLCHEARVPPEGRSVRCNTGDGWQVPGLFRHAGTLRTDQRDGRSPVRDHHQVVPHRSADNCSCALRQASPSVQAIRTCSCLSLGRIPLCDRRALRAWALSA